MILFSLPVLLIAAAVCVTLFLWRCISSPLSKVPGPLLSRFTPLALRWHEFRANRTLYIHSLHLKHGPVVRIAPDEMSFTSYEAVKEIYGTLGSGYDKSSFYNLFTVFGRRWVSLSFFIYANSNVMKPASLVGIESRAQTFAEQCGGETSADVYVKLHAFACDGVTHHLFQPYGTDCLRSSPDQEIMHQVNGDDSLHNRFVERRATPLADNYALHTSRLDDSEEFTLLHRLRGKVDDQLSVDDVAAECLDHMVAGIDTTGDVLCFLMWELSLPRSAQFQKELRQELHENPDTVFDKLPILDAVVQEGLRCFPAIPMSLPRVVPEGGKVIDGVFIPGETIVSCQAYSVQRHNTVVFPEPDRFNPHRWMSPEGDADRKRHMFAFSHGGRGCVGKHLALAEMKILLRQVYSKYQTVPDPSMTDESMRPHDQIISARPYGQKCLLRFAPVDTKA
ncbi:hypothetical protein FDECE_13987 [Fusarium decemcellulare]|nr:hypothetical protein FDECE_13987 [Fusarium decemcellulare]